MKFRIHFFMVIALLTGCASGQLNYNTLEIAGTVDDLLASQISYNLVKFIQDENAIPSQVSIPFGSVTTTNQVGVNWADPLTPAVTASNQVVSGGSFPRNQITSTVQKAAASNVLTPSATNQWSQNWELAPITDSDQMRRLAALYRYVANPGAADLCRDYPIISAQAFVGTPTSNSSADDAVWRAVADGGANRASLYESYLKLYNKHAWAARRLARRIENPPPNATEEYEKQWDKALRADVPQLYADYIEIHENKSPPENDHVSEARERLIGLLKAVGKAAAEAQSQAGNGSAVQTSDGPITVTASDGQFLREPSCIICSKMANEQNISRSPKTEIERNSCSRHGNDDLYVNPRLRSGWLVYCTASGECTQVTPLGPIQTPPEGLCSIGHSGGFFLYTRDTRAYNEFILFIMEATAQGSTAGQSGKNSGAKVAGAAVPAGAQLIITP